MEEFFKNEDELLQGIISKDGDCVNVAWCLVCPFASECISKAISHARLLPKDQRVRLAYGKLFDKLMENELDDSN